MFVRWNSKEYKIINDIKIQKSSREVTYSDLTIDFSKCKIDDLPYVQQEVEIVDEDGNLKFTGFVAEYTLPELKRIITPEKELFLSLYSPRQLTTKRTVTIMRTAKMSAIINQVLSPLFEDGFNLKEINIEDKTITVNLISRTVEEVLNYLSNKYSLYWNIDELKEIEISSLTYMLNKETKKKINIKNYKKEIEGLLSLTPSVANTDYANIINVKNARIFYEKFQDSGLNVSLENGDRIDFENPIDISLETAKRILEITEDDQTGSCTNLQINYGNGQTAYIVSGFNTDGDIKPRKQL